MDCLVPLVPSIGGRRRWNGPAKALDSATVGAFFVGISQPQLNVSVTGVKPQKMANLLRIGSISHFHPRGISTLEEMNEDNGVFL
jgi:hypothetical protein